MRSRQFLENAMGVEVREDLTVAIGRAAVRLTPSEAMQLGERLIRRSTVRMVEEEIARIAEPQRSAAEEKPQ
jgi:hypothetical protein